jgi:hypothetical protein
MRHRARSLNRIDLFCLFGLLVVAVGVLGWMLFGGVTIGNDYPEYQVIYALIPRFYEQMGIEPLWYPHLEGGVPMGGLTMSQAYHFPAWLLSKMPGYFSGGILSLITFKHIVLTFVITASIYLGFRKLSNLPRSASFLLAVTLHYQMRSLDCLRYGTFYDAYVYLFVCSLCILLFAQSVAMPYLVAIFALSYLSASAGYPPVIFYFAVVNLFVIPIGIRRLGCSWNQTARLLCISAIPLVLGFLFAAPHWLPMAEFLQLNSVRSQGSTIEWANTYALPVTGVFPEFLRGWYTNLITPWYSEVHSAFAGSTTFSILFVTLLFFLPLSGPGNISLVFILVFPLIFAAGRDYGLFVFFYKYVPGFSSFRIPGRFLATLPWVMFVVIIVVCQQRSSRSDRLFLRVFLVVAFLLLLIAGWQAYVGRELPFLSSSTLAGGYYPATIHSSWSGVNLFIWHALSLVLLFICCLTGAVFFWCPGFFKGASIRFDPNCWFSVFFILIMPISIYQNYLIFRHGSWLIGRAPSPTFEEIKSANHLPLAATAPLVGYQGYNQGAVGSATTSFRNFIEVGNNSQSSECLQSLWKQPTEQVVKIPFYLTNRIKRIREKKHMDSPLPCDLEPAAALNKSDFVRVRSLLGSNKDSENLYALNKHNRVEVLTPNRIVMSYKTEDAAFMVTPLPWIPQWRVLIDNVVTDSIRTDSGLVGAVVPVGNHRVAFAYTSNLPLIALVVSAVSAIVGLCLLFGTQNYHIGQVRIGKYLSVVMVVVISVFTVWLYKSTLSRIDSETILTNDYDKRLALQLELWKR